MQVADADPDDDDTKEKEASAGVFGFLGFLLSFAHDKPPVTDESLPLTPLS